MCILKLFPALNSYCSDSKTLPMFWYHSCTKMSSDRSDIVHDFLVNFNSYEYREVQSRQKNCYNLLSNWRRLNLFTSISFSLNAIAKHYQGRFCQKHFRTSFTLRYGVWRLVLVMSLRSFFQHDSDDTINGGGWKKYLMRNTCLENERYYSRYHERGRSRHKRAHDAKRMASIVSQQLTYW